MAASEWPELIAGRYRPIGEIGRGGMGSVLLVEHVNTGDKLALKFLHKSFSENSDLVERFKREARAAAKIKSDHVVRITDADVSPELGGLPFMVMEVLEGQDVRKRLRDRGMLTKDEVVNILWQVGRALDRAHAIGIIHRDIKPENIFLHVKEDGTEIVKLLDFGISKTLDDMDQNSTQAGMMLGTPYFMAPEQVRTAAVSAQTDIWAIGMVAFKLLAGVNYWPSGGTGELMVAVLTAPMDAPSARPRGGQMNAAFDAWFFRSCDRDALKRWASVGEQVSALADALGVALPASVSGVSNPSLPASQSQSGQLPISFVPTHAAPLPPITAPAASAASASFPAAATGGSFSSNAMPAPSPPPRSSASSWVIGASILVITLAVVALGSWRLIRHLGSPPTQNVNVSAPSIAAQAETPSAQTPTPIATQAPIETTAPIATQVASASAQPIPSATTKPTTSSVSTATHSHNAATKKPAQDTPAKGEDPWAR